MPMHILHNWLMLPQRAGSIYAVFRVATGR